MSRQLATHVQLAVPRGAGAETGGRNEGTNSWLGWPNQRLPHACPCSSQGLVLARTQRGNDDLHAMPFSKGLRAGPSIPKPKLLYPSSRYRHASFSLPINPALSVTSYAEAVTASTDKATLYCISFELHYHYRFLSRGRERFLPSARYLYRSFLQYPEYLDHPILLSLSLL